MEIKLVNLKGDQPWIFFGRTDAKAPTLCQPDVKSQLTGKDPHAMKDWGQKEKEEAEGEMVRKHHWHEFEQNQGDNKGQGSLVCCSPCSLKELDMI